MYSSEGERVELIQHISTSEAKGAVEKWLVQVEDVMIRSVRDVVARSRVVRSPFQNPPKCIGMCLDRMMCEHNSMAQRVWLCRQAYAETARSQWVREWPGQVVLCTSQIFWTLEVHEAIRAGPDVGLYTFFSEDVTGFVRFEIPVV